MHGYRRGGCQFGGVESVCLSASGCGCVMLSDSASDERHVVLQIFLWDTSQSSRAATEEEASCEQAGAVSFKQFS